MLLTPGYWQSTYWSNSYWNNLYWPFYGEDIINTIEDIIIKCYKKIDIFTKQNKHSDILNDSIKHNDIIKKVRQN